MSRTPTRNSGRSPGISDGIPVEGPRRTIQRVGEIFSEIPPGVPSEIHHDVTSGMIIGVFSMIVPVLFGISSAFFAGILTRSSW